MDNKKDITIGYELFEACEKNPFIGYDNKIISKDRIRYGKATEEVMEDDGGNVMNRYHKIGTVEKVDSDKFVQIYLKGLDAMFDLSSTGQKIIGYIIKHCLKPNDDKIYFSKNDCRDKLNYKTRNSVYAGLVELLQKGFIAKVKGDTNLLFINPHYLFNGKRFAFFQAYEQKESDFNRDHSTTNKQINP